jgi:hypothetical protein
MKSVKSVPRLEIKKLKEIGVLSLAKNQVTEMEYSDGTVFLLDKKKLGEDEYLRVRFTVNFSNGESKDFERLIYIIERPSNLMKGVILYFGCPSSGSLAKTLYFDFKDFNFKSFKYYNYPRRRLYYPLQMVSGKSRLIAQERAYYNKISLLEEKAVLNTYNGDATQLNKRIEKLYIKLDDLHYILLRSVAKILARANTSVS